MKILFAIVSLFAVVWYWQDSLRSRELALKKCRRLCEDHNVQFLDQSVHVARVRLGKTTRHNIFIRRFYAFEFSIGGVDRHHGVAVVSRDSMEYLSLLHPDGEIIEGSLPN
ncbi:MAG: DUF3301 domain-containing protein [Gammaproteobacteria bacterium]|nr:MAG: DUF3301 domain-containing protein [Gammaproteobacteria bacterium]